MPVWPPPERIWEARISQPHAHVCVGCRAFLNVASVEETSLPHEVASRHAPNVLKGFNLFETVFNTASLLHGAAPLLGLGRERNRAFSSPINAKGRTVMGDSMERLKSQRCSVLLTR
jgi:hypothetical protein